MSTTRNSTIRTVQRAVDALGGVHNLAAYLNVGRSQVEDWIDGRVEIPPEVFGAALDVVAAGPFAAWRGHDDSEMAERHREHANRLQETAQRIKASAERAQRIADQAQRNADRSTALAQVQQVLVSAIREQNSDRPAELSSDKLVDEQSTAK